MTRESGFPHVTVLNEGQAARFLDTTVQRLREHRRAGTGPLYIVVNERHHYPQQTLREWTGRIS